MSMTHLIKYCTLPPVDFVDKVNSYGQKGIRGKRERERERERDLSETNVTASASCYDLFVSTRDRVPQLETAFLVRSLSCSSSWSPEDFDVAAGFSCRRLVI